MSYYKLLQVDIIQTSQLYLGGGVNASLPSAANVLYSDGLGGTYWSTPSFQYLSTSELVSTVDGLGTAGYVSTSYFNDIINALGQTYISTSAPGYGDVRYFQLISTTEGLGQIYISSAIFPFIVSTPNLTSTTDGLGKLYISTLSLVSTVNNLGNIGYVSSASLQSTITGLGQIYQSAPNVVFATDLSTGISTNFLQATTVASSNLTANSMYTGTLFASTSITTQDAPVNVNYTGSAPANPIAIAVPAANAVAFSITAGSENNLTLGIDGTQTAILTSQNPGVGYNPLLVNASYIKTLATSNLFVPDTSLTPNNTQIIGSTISTGILLANQGLFSSLVGDGSQIYNLGFVSSATVGSTIAGFLQELNVVSTPTLQSTIIGLNNYLGYLSSAGLGPIVSTALMTASSIVVASQLQTASIFMSTTITSSNLWVAGGIAATPADTLEYSGDGLNWASAASGGFSAQANDVGWNGSSWVAVGQDATAANCIQYSLDGRNWTPASGATFSVQGNAVAWNGSVWVAGGVNGTSANTLKYSFNGITWFNSSGTGFSTGANAVLWNGRLWTAVGQDTTNVIRYSVDGVNWLSAQTAYSDTLYTVAWNGTFYLAGGVVNSPGTGLLYSSDSLTWSIVPSAPFQSAVYHLAWNGTLWVASSTENTVTNSRYSYDGLTWITGSGTTFLSGGRSAAWNGTVWVQGGADITQTSLLKQSLDGRIWVNSAANNFTTVNTVAFSVNLTPFYQQPNFAILPQANPLFLTSTNTLMFTPSGMTLNYSLYIDNKTDYVGVNCNAPSYTLDVYGSANVSSIMYASSFVGDGSRLQNVATNFNTSLFISTPSLLSSLMGLGSMGYISSANFSSLALQNFISTSSLNDALASTTTGLLTYLRFTSTLYASTNFSSITANSLLISSIITSSITASTGTFSTVLTSSIIAAVANIQAGTIQQATVSSIQFYQGDGFFAITDLQTSNLSTIAFWTSTILTNTVQTSNIFLGRAPFQTPIQFYGRGNYATTVIAEQSTGLISQELLLFKGSTLADQVRIQTTGPFILETGVSERSWPNAPQQSTASMNIDIFGNVNFRSTFVASITNNFVGINCNAPGVALDVNGQIRGNAALLYAMNALSTPPLRLSTSVVYTSSIITSTSIVDVEWVSSLTTSTIVTSNISTLILLGNQFLTSSIITNTLAVNTLSTNTLTANTAYFSTLYASSFSTSVINVPQIITSSIQFFQGDGIWQVPDLQTSNISTIQLWTSTILTNTVLTSNIYLGQQGTQTPIQFYGRGNYATTVLAEQSTGIYSQEFLIFKGSTTNDQIRLQTTGNFILETGASSRNWPNAATIGGSNTAAFYVDSQCNVMMNGGTFFLSNAGTQRSGGIGIGTSNPAYQLDVVGTMRAQIALTSTLTTSTVTVINAYMSTLTLSSFALLNGSTMYSQLNMNNVINASTINTSNLFASTATISTVLTTSTLIANNAIFSTLNASSISSFYISTNTLFATNLLTSSLLTSSLTTTTLLTQTMAVSSLNFYSGDGYFLITDLQSSNISTIATYTSSIAANTGRFLTSVGINNTAPIFTLDVNGNARISTLTVDAGAGVTSTNTTFSLAVWGAGGPARVGGTTWTQISDQRMKENIVDADLDKCYADIKAVQLRRFTYTSTFFDAVPLGDRNVLGFIAQEVQQLQPKAITVSGGFGISDLNWLNIDQMNMSLYGAVKKLMKNNEELTSSVMGLQMTLISSISGGNV